MLFGLLDRFFGRSVDLEVYLRKTKRIKVKGVRFEIRKINLQDHLAGLNVVMQLHDVYKKEKPKDPTKIVDDVEKLRRFMRDFIYAGVASPRLTMKDPPEEGATPVDAIVSDIPFAQELCMRIMHHSNGKKN